MFYLQKATPQNAKKWLYLVQQNRIELEKWMPYLKEIKTEEQAEAYIQKNARLDFYLGVHFYEIWAENILVGLVSLHSGRVTDKSVQLAYWLGSAYVGNGYATKACQFLISKTVIEYRIQVFRIHCLRTNLPSKKLAIHLGFDLEKEENDILHFAISRAKWLECYYEEEDLFNFLEEID
jgi:ribosomal-protein-serine acetyltransferase